MMNLFKNFLQFCQQGLKLSTNLILVTPQDAPKISDSVMDALLQMLSGPGGRSGGVQEDALMAISTLTEVMGEQFIKYMDSFRPFLIAGLANVGEYTVGFELTFWAR